MPSLPRASTQFLRASIIANRSAKYVLYTHKIYRDMSQSRGRPPKRFAPLDPDNSNPAGAPILKGIVFDVDGTLWYVRFLDVDRLCEVLSGL